VALTVRLVGLIDLRFDDRLLTVLSQPGSDRHDVAVRWRQLVDLVARAGANAASPATVQALETIRADGPRVDENLRAAAARAIAALPLPLGLLTYFASERLSVSAPILAAAHLDARQWGTLLASADEEVRKFVETLHPEIRPAAPDRSDELVYELSDEVPAEPATPSLHELVERIEQRRRTRAVLRERSAGTTGREAGPGLFRWECGPGGEIDWVDGVPRGSIIGRSIARAHGAGSDLLDREVVRSFSIRAPFRNAVMTVGGEAAASGQWKISGVPAFDPADGRFVGYRGIALREGQEPAGTSADVLPDADSIRELVHEIKTPLTAIIGFAEIIEGQFLGPAEQVYRDRAQEIVSQARLLLNAIDDLDFVARVHSAAGAHVSPTSLGMLVERITPALRESAAERGVEIEASRPIREVLAAAEPELADRLIFRLCSAVLASSEAGERLRLTVEQTGDRCKVSITKPNRLAARSEDELMESGANFELGFPLRLLRGLARSARAELISTPRALSLTFARF
jgi:hypothetical protein